MSNDLALPGPERLDDLINKDRTFWPDGEAGSDLIFEDFLDPVSNAKSYALTHMLISAKKYSPTEDPSEININAGVRSLLMLPVFLKINWYGEYL